MATKKILIVDDDTLFTDSLKAFLQDKDWEVSVINDGMGILTTISTLQPDIILLDIMMQNVNGLDELKEIQETMPDQTKRVIMLTSVEGDASLAKALELGVDTYLQKSTVSQEEVLAAVERKLAML